MPDRWTFKIKPIKSLLKEEVGNGLWCDPYCGYNSPAQITNDLNPSVPASCHLDALDFLKQQGTAVYDGVLFDPPYSLRQLKECYEGIGIKPAPELFNARYQALQKDEIARIVKPGGKAISFGWHTNGTGKCRGFELLRVLIVPHGRQHNDTLVTVERKIQTSL